jgi:hypothetical protein
MSAPMCLEDHLSCHFCGTKVDANVLISHAPTKDLKLKDLLPHENLSHFG